MRHPVFVVILSLLAVLCCSTAMGVDVAAVDRLVMAKDIDVAAVKRQGEAVMPVLAMLYKQTDDRTKRTKIARLFYELGWKSEAAKEAMMADVHTDDRNLRLQVQWALGRVSNDDIVVEVLLDNMQDDTNPLFRDKAACALAYDQIHLTPKQKFKLLTGLVEALDDAKPDVRHIAFTALSIHTGQTKGYNPGAPDAERRKKIQEWKAWLGEYGSNL